jgi:hypothetical protein
MGRQGGKPATNRLSYGTPLGNKLAACREQRGKVNKWISDSLWAAANNEMAEKMEVQDASKTALQLWKLV